MPSFSIADAAERLGVNQQRVRALAAEGRLPAHKLGRSWLIDAESLDRFRQRPRAGRPISSANAWALLALLSGEPSPWVDPSVRSRLKRRASDSKWLVEAIGWSEPRSDVHHLRFLPNDIERLRLEPGLVWSGLSANYSQIDVRSHPDEFDAYIGRQQLDGLLRRFRPEVRSSNPNVLLRVPSNEWVRARGDLAPLAVVAADLLDHDEARVVRAGRQALEGHRL